MKSVCFLYEINESSHQELEIAETWLLWNYTENELIFEYIWRFLSIFNQLGSLVR